MIGSTLSISAIALAWFRFDVAIPPNMNMKLERDFIIYTQDNIFSSTIYYLQDDESIFVVFDPPVYDKEIKIESDFRILSVSNNIDFALTTHTNLETPWLSTLDTRFRPMTYDQKSLIYILYDLKIPANIRQKMIKKYHPLRFWFLIYVGISTLVHILYIGVIMLCA
nr:hypothetical protein [Abalone asfa-like virus]